MSIIINVVPHLLCMTLIRYLGNPFAFYIFYHMFLLKRTKAFSQSTNVTCVCKLNSLLFSVICHFKDVIRARPTLSKSWQSSYNSASAIIFIFNYCLLRLFRSYMIRPRGLAPPPPILSHSTVQTFLIKKITSVSFHDWGVSYLVQHILC